MVYEEEDSYNVEDLLETVINMTALYLNEVTLKLIEWIDRYHHFNKTTN